MYKVGDKIRIENTHNPPESAIVIIDGWWENSRDKFTIKILEGKIAGLEKGKEWGYFPVKPTSFKYTLIEEKPMYKKEILVASEIKKATRAWEKSLGKPLTKEAQKVNEMIDEIDICPNGKDGVRKLIEWLEPHGKKIKLTGGGGWTVPGEGVMVHFMGTQLITNSDTSHGNSIYSDGKKDGFSWNLFKHESLLRPATNKEIDEFVDEFNSRDTR